MWADFTVSRVSLRRGLRRFFRDGRLRRTEFTLSFYTELNDGSHLATRVHAARFPTQLESFTAAAVQSHMRTLEAHLLEHHPLKPALQLDLRAVLAAERRASLQAPRQAPLTAEALDGLGVPPHLARLIAGPCANQRETLPI